MGKKSTPKVPERYELEELLKYNTDMNRFDSYNDFGSQKWTQDGDRWTMTQAIDPKFKGMIDDQMSFVNNRGGRRLETPGPMKDMFQALMDKRAQVSGATPGYHPDVPQGQMPTPPDQQGQMDTGEGAPEGSMMPGHSVAPVATQPAVSEDLIRALATNGNGMAAAGGAMRNALDRRKANK